MNYLEDWIPTKNDTWTHVVIVKDEDITKLYLNGELQQWQD